MRRGSRAFTLGWVQRQTQHSHPRFMGGGKVPIFLSLLSRLSCFAIPLFLSFSLMLSPRSLCPFFSASTLRSLFSLLAHLLYPFQKGGVLAFTLRHALLRFGAWHKRKKRVVLHPFHCLKNFLTPSHVNFVISRVHGKRDDLNFNNCHICPLLRLSASIFSRVNAM